MTLYHGSSVSGLTVLKPQVTEYFGKPRQVCLTASLPMALLYGLRHYEYTYGYTGERQIYYEEYFPNALRELYQGKGLLYIVASAVGIWSLPSSPTNM